MAAWLNGELRRAFGVLIGVCALFLVLAGNAFAHHKPGHDNGGGNGNACDAPGNAYGHDNCDPPAEPAAEPVEPAPEPVSPEPAEPSVDVDAPAPAPDVEAPAEPVDPPAAAPVSEPVAAPAPEQPEPSAPPMPPAPAGGWEPVVARPERPPAEPAPRPAAARSRTFSSRVAPEASWGTPDASWSQGRGPELTPERFGVEGTSAVVAIRRGAGIAGSLAFRVQMTRGHSTFAFRASRSIVAGSGGRLYRIGAWLRSDVAGLNVCLRIQEMSAGDKLVPARTTESCLVPMSEWKRFRVYRKTLARGNRLVFSIYSYGAVEGDSFEVNRFTVSRRVKNGWRRVDAAFGKPVDSN